ncbi:DUF3037 domain-containing protein [Chitinophaga nivalis]|uniref:DUF3037 domain-containing protein n=1 Tax=Chitinophaga nivalis TaxID=2991709 RepID=A0ABT3IGS3_9BACT|nr:DUF3037 domain-containing protein [Chitinophaga nivalis]MCW3467162.1 DUF3037 domain-containing protein [Chitinophaga nivalis]MCW3483146.1 DUF3037 domain-containing protein [Chitinophaga nivalis]
MPENHLFEYAVIRIVPRVEREEFLNVGVILYCKQQRFLETIFTLDESRIYALYPETDIASFKAYLCAFQHICQGQAAGGPISALDMASRFRWLTATRSSILQCSKVHPGLTTDARSTLERLQQHLVL